VAIAPPQILVKIDLKVVFGGEIAVAAFGSENMMARAVPIQAAFTKPCARGDDRLIAFDRVAADGNHVIEGNDIG